MSAAGDDPDDILEAALADVAAAEREVGQKAREAAEAGSAISAGSEAAAMGLDAACSKLAAAQGKADEARAARRRSRGSGAGGLPRCSTSQMSAGSAGLCSPITPGGATAQQRLSAKEASERFGLARQFSAEVDPQQADEQQQPDSSAGSDAGDAGGFEPGMLVEIQGLSSQRLTKMNGRRGRVIAVNDERGRVEVNLGGEYGVRAVRPSNLKRIEEAPAAPPVRCAGEALAEQAAAKLAAEEEQRSAAEARMLQAWKAHVEEVGNETSVGTMAAAFSGFVYPLEDSMLFRLLGRVGAHLCEPRVAMLRSAGVLERLHREVKRGIRLTAPEGTELLLQALYTRVATAVGARLVAITPRSLAAVLDAAGEDFDLTTGRALQILLNYLRSTAPGVILVLQDRDALLQSASLCNALQTELDQPQGNIFVLTGDCTADDTPKTSKPHHSGIPLTVSLGKRGAGDDSDDEAGDVPDEIKELVKQAVMAGLMKDLAGKLGGGGGGGGDGSADGTSSQQQGSPLLGADQLTDTVKRLADAWPGGSRKQLNIHWRRMAQLGDNEVAHATLPRFPGKSPADEHQHILGEVMPEHRKLGLPDYSEGLKKLWAGERDPAKLTSGLCEDGASILRMLLRELESQIRRLKEPTDFSEDDMERLRLQVEADLSPSDRARLIAARAAAAESAWPPKGVKYNRNSAGFLLKRELELRRVAQLAIPEVATRNKSAKFGEGGDPEVERGLARAAVQGWVRSGWMVSDAVEAMWRGARSEEELTKGLDPGSTVVVCVLLRCIEQEEKRHKEGRTADAEGPGESAAEWSCKQGERGWQVYSPQDTAMLEAAYKAGLERLEDVSVTFSEWKYTFDFRLMKQINSKTGKERELRRKVYAEAAEGESGAPRMPQTPRSSAAQRRALNDFLEHITVEPPKDSKKLQLWRKLLRRDAEGSKRQDNLQVLRRVCDDRGLVCPCLEAVASHGGGSDLGQRLSTRKLSDEEADEVMAEAIVHGVGLGTSAADDHGRLVISEQSLLFALVTKCGLEKQTGQRGMSEEEVRRLVGKNKYESQMLEGLISPEDVGVKWDEVGGLKETKELLREAAVYPLKYPELYQIGSVSVSPPGVLLFGPPGTGKTLLAKAVATETGASFLLVDSTSIGSKWYGESEKFARAVFTLARKVAPAIIFIDEIDSLAAARDSDERGTVATVKTTLLREWDGLAGGNQGVMVIGATNRPHALDEAVLSRMPQRVFVDLPTPEELGEIFRIQLRDVPKEPDIDVEAFARKELQGYVGRDIKELVRVVAHAAGHDVARRLEQGGVAPGQGEVAQARRPITRAELLQAKQKVRPLGGKGDSGSILKLIREWMEKVGIDDPRGGKKGQAASMYM